LELTVNISAANYQRHADHTTALFIDAAYADKAVSRITRGDTINMAVKIFTTKLITFYRSTYFPDDVVDGGIDYSSTDTETFLVDSVRHDDETSVDTAVRLLGSTWVTESSVSPITLQNAHNIWFSNPDGDSIVSHYTGERESVTAHLIGYSDADMFDIATRLAS
jgi:hypothetical protein